MLELGGGREGPGDRRTPVTVLTGFLGSGKTSLLARALRSPDFADTAVVINEAGAMGLDHLLVEAAPDRIAELPNGCLCCLARADIAQTLADLLERRRAGLIRPFARLVIETSGLADPAPILGTFAADPMLGHEVTLRAVVTLVDALHGDATLRAHPEARAQVAMADRLVLTKTDIAVPPPGLAEQLDGLNRWGERTTSGQASPAPLLFGPLAHTASAFRAVPGEATPHTPEITTHSLVLAQPPTRLAFATALGRFATDRGADLLRAKGLVAFADRPGHVAVIHAVQHTIARPEWLSGWPDHDTRSRLVLVLRGITRTEVMQRLAGLDPIAWSPVGSIATVEPSPTAVAHVPA